MEEKNLVQRLSWWQGWMEVCFQMVAVEVRRKEGLQTYSGGGHFLLPNGLFLHPYVSFLNSMFPPHHKSLIHLHIVGHCSHSHHSLPNDRDLDTIRQQFCVVFFLIIIIGHYWSGTAPRNLRGFIHLILTTI